jgi:hypothetical protein
MKRLVLILVAILAPSTAQAESLPGVKQPEQTVQPLPEPIDQQATTDKGAVRVGDWDVKVSGSIIVDIGAGNIKRPKR